MRGKHLKGKDKVSVLGGLLDARVKSRVHSWRLKVMGGVSVCDWLLKGERLV